MLPFNEYMQVMEKAYCNEEVADYANKKNCRYWGDSGAGILPFAKDTARFLPNRRSMSVNEGGTLGIFGGGFWLGRGVAASVRTTEELLRNEEIPKNQAKQELYEEIGYRGPIELVLLYRFEDAPCEFYYWNYLGIVENEFARHGSSEDAGSDWMTFEQLMAAEPKHFGLKALLANAGSKLKQIAGQHQQMALNMGRGTQTWQAM